MRASAHHHDRAGDTAAHDLAQPHARAGVGRSTLTESLFKGGDAAPATKPLFDGDVSWEAIDPHEAAAEAEEDGAEAGDAAHEQAQLAHLMAAPEAGEQEGDETVAAAGPSEAADGAAPAAAVAPEEPAVEPEAEHDEDHDDDAKHDDDADHDDGADHDDDADDDDAEAGPVATAAVAGEKKTQKKEKKQGKGKPKTHPLERTTKKASKEYFAKRDKYNRKSIRNNRKSKNKKLRKNQISRPGVRVGNRDAFKLEQSPAPRYLITNGAKAEPMDLITKEYLAKDHRMALNPAHSRTLELPDGTKELCALVWVGSKGSGFMPIRFIHGNHAEIKKQVDRRNREWGPAKASTKHVVRYVFIDGDAPGASARDQRAVADPKQDRQTFILPNQKSGKGNHTSDYLQHTSFSTGLPGGVKRDYININMNLPASHVPPVAIDTAKPGQFFFVPRGEQFFREIAIYRLHKNTSKRRQTWVYGFVAKQGPKGPVPDEKRRGWVPLRTVKKG